VGFACQASALFLAARLRRRFVGGRNALRDCSPGRLAVDPAGQPRRGVRRPPADGRRVLTPFGDYDALRTPDAVSGVCAVQLVLDQGMHW
jgi:hypothetical protein